MNWQRILDESALAALLPTSHAHFARPVIDALAVFLEGLPESHQAEILSRQASLPLTATMSTRLRVLAQCCPVLQKLGQVLARDRRLAVPLRLQLRKLESLPPSVPMRTIRDTLTRELGDPRRRGITLAPRAIAEASVAVVVPFVDDEGRKGVFKILKPNIEQRLELELGLLEQVGAHLDRCCEQFRLPRLDYEESFRQVRNKLMDEIRLDQEQLHLSRARRFYAVEPLVQVPELFDACTPRITAMQRIEGCKVTDHSLEARRGKRKLARLVIRAMLSRPIFSRDQDALFHGDPHAGNLFHTEDGRLAILDWSLVGTLGEPERVAMARILLGALALDAPGIADLLASLAERGEPDRSTLMSVAERAVAQVRRGRPPGMSWLVGLLDSAVTDAGLRVRPDMLLFRKSLHTLEGVVAEVGASGGALDEVLLLDFLRHFALEWPRRWASSPTSRRFATRLSNLDLTRTMTSGPVVAARFWTGHALDALAACRENASRLPVGSNSG